ncbi:MAG TPA: uroporphyrinogen-III C-methyltransferase [Longimicrobiales bacterium]|nr:uroporphyrinogen-III C-methyltransferase [Longimicrobiales bacterium]
MRDTVLPHPVDPAPRNADAGPANRPSPYRTGRGTGTVYLVGAGPGDPGLLTVRALRLLRRADVVFHDSLVSDGVLRLVVASAECVNVGKRAGGRSTDQAVINRMLIDAARRARTVVRLKGGDPLIFGRGGEEALAVRDAGVRCRIVPGVTAALGVAAYAGIPMTHRGVSSKLTFVTGREGEDASDVRVDWSRHGEAGETLAIYMGVRGLPSLATRLIRAGRDAATPVALVENGTLPRQRTIEAPLGRIGDVAAAAGITGPALIVIGEVVALRQRSDCFEARALHGVSILVARSRPQRSRLARRLAGLGADVLQAPAFDALPAPDASLDAALLCADAYDWIAFTDETAVAACWDAARRVGRDARIFGALRFAAFGRATAAALQRRGVRADVVLHSFAPAAISAAFDEYARSRPPCVLFPRIADQRSEAAAALRNAGAVVHEVIACRTAARDDGGVVRGRLENGEIDVVVFASSNSVQVFRRHVGPLVARARIAAIGPRTARAAEAAGFTPHVVANATLDSLVRALRA